MWNHLRRLITPLTKEAILPVESCIYQQQRTTYILKRKYEPQLHKIGSHPKRLKNRHYIYEMVKCTISEPRKPLDVILTTYVPGLGNIGDKVSVKPNYGYNHLLLTGKAVYASPQYIEKYKEFANKDDEVAYSSATVQYTLGKFSRMILSVVMNMENPWVLKPWHIRVAFRKSGHEVPEDAITMPEREISGPNLDIQGKEFYITVTINKKEPLKVRCRIHHWSTVITERLQYNPQFFLKPTEAIFAEDVDILASMPNKAKAVEIEQ